MRISFILSSLWLSGGVRVIVEYANRLQARGHQVALIAPGSALDSEMLTVLNSSVEVRQSPVSREPRMNTWQLASLAWSLARNVPPSDVVISTHTPTTAAGFLATRLLRRGRPAWLCQDYRGMFVDRPLEDWLMRHALRWHELGLVVTDYLRQELNRYSPGKVVVVGEGLNEIYRPLPSQPRRPDSQTQTILFLGDMRPRKGLHDFLQAADLVHQSMANIKLLIVSKEECHIESSVRFDYIHRPTDAELARQYAICDLFVSASWWEGFGLPPLEAMACGAPVVLTDSGGVREYARPGKNCLMVPPRSPEALAAAMVRVLTDATLAQILRSNGPPTAAQFTWDKAVERLEGALLSLLDQCPLIDETLSTNSKAS
jgi:glycosyltransferase involved in cell wall biosynthesis